MDISVLHAPSYLLVASLTGALLGTAAAQNHLKPKQIQQEGFEIIGITARTNNAKEMTGDGAIPLLWKRFYSDTDTFFDRVPAKTDNSVYAAYTDYASDAAGDYTFVLGARVKPGTRPPEGMIAVQVPAGRYLQFTTEQGHSQPWCRNCGATSTRTRTGATSQRAFKTDYEIYEAGMDPANSTGTIYIGVSKARLAHKRDAKLGLLGG